MKKILSVLLAALMLMSFAGCKITPVADVDDDKPAVVTPEDDEPVVEDEPAAEDEPDVEFTLGEIDGSVYTNEFAELTFAAPAGWSFVSDEDIAALMGVAVEIITEGKLDADYIGTMYGMMVQSSDMQSNVQVTFENLSASGKKLSAESYMALLKIQLPAMYQKMDAECEIGDTSTIELCGNEYCYMDLSVDLNGHSITQAYACRKIGDYLVNIVFTASSESVLAEQIACFGADAATDVDGIDTSGLVVCDTGEGLTVSLPSDVEEWDPEGFTKAYLNSSILFTCVKETHDEIASVGFENVTLEEYAELSQIAYEIDTPYSIDTYGNLSTNYTSDVDGDLYYYYVVIREGSDCFWTATFACLESDKDIYADQFAQWGSTITVE